MSLLAVLETIGNGIEEMQKENRALEEQLKEANKRAETWYQLYQESQAVNVKEAESVEFLKKRLREAMNDRDEYKAKLEAVEEYRKRLAQECENVSNEEEIKERGR